jgi:tetratricopeptide (TPR) repeat protein
LKLAAVLMAITLIVFLPALKNDFVSWDDDENITANSNVQQMSPEGIKGIFSSTVTGGYTPLTSFTFMLEYHFFGMKPFAYHLNNMLLHALCTLLVFILMRRLGLSLFISFTTALLFGIHPMRVESVAWISERKDVLYGALFLLSMLFYIRYRDVKRKLFYFLALGTFLLSLLTKIQAVTLPLALVLIDYFFEKKFTVRQLIDKVPFFALSLITGLVGIYILKSGGELETGTLMPLIQRLFIGTFSFCTYLYKVIIPWPLSAIYPYPDAPGVLHYASAAAVLLLGFLLYRYGRHRKELVFGSLFFLFNVIFMLQIVGAGQALMADRFTYVGYIGLFFIIAWVLEPIFSGRYRNIAIAGGLGWMVILGVMTWKQTAVWKTTETLFTDVVSKYPEVPVAWNNLGIYYRDNNQREKAIGAYSRAIELNPDSPLIYNNRGELYFSKGDVDKALNDMNMALKMNPGYVKALTNRGAVYGSRGENSQALKDLDKAISLDSLNLPAISNRILVYYQSGNPGRAINDATEYIRIKPNEPDIYNIRGLCLAELGRHGDAVADYNRAIPLSPDAGAYYQNRSASLYALGDIKGALRDAGKATSLGIKMDPEFIKKLQ